MKIASVGADWGGSWLRVAGVDEKGRTVFCGKRPSPSRSRLVPALRSVLSRRHVIEPSVLVLGGKGIWKKSARRAWARRLAPLARRVVATSDIEIAHAAAFGGGPGVLILAGTGSIALGIDSKGRFARAGGLGPEKGDEGSGYWIGKKYLAWAGGRKASVRETATLASLVLKKSRRLDPLCREIVIQAQDHLAVLGARVARSLWRKGSVPLSWAGGLMEDRFFRRGVLERSRIFFGAFGLRMRPIAPRREPALAAALYGLRTKK